ncbi:hypothetical protein ACFL5O_07375 [Myxococcota bacterium]
MKRWLATVRLDVLLQARNQLYPVGIAVALGVGGLVRWVTAPELLPRFLPAFLFLGLGSTTWMFGAAMILFEKQQQTVDAMRVTPLRPTEYLMSKLVTLTLFAMLESLIVLAVNYDVALLEGIRWAILLPAMSVVGAIYTLIGVAQVVSARNIAEFLIPGAVVLGLIVQLPLLAQLGVSEHWIWYVVPTGGPLWLLQGAFHPLSPGQWAYAVVVTPVFALGLSWLALRRLEVHVFGTRRMGSARRARSDEFRSERPGA